jgi:hypothetical protein
MENENKIIKNKREKEPLAERIKLARQIFIERYKKYLKLYEPEKPPEFELTNLKTLENGEKINSYRIALDMAARVCQENGVWAFDFKEIAAIYDELFTDWQESEWVNWGKNNNETKKI